jgi:ribosomal protein S18 acetylase RimI-like enzyme
VCSLTLSLSENDARIDDVATMPEHQKQGHATNLIYAALQKAKQLNVSQCFLEASGSGFNLYKRIGFNTLFKNHYYEKL